MTKVSSTGILLKTFSFLPKTSDPLYQDIYVKSSIERNGNSYHPDELDAISLIAKAVRFIRKFKLILFSFALAGLCAGLYFYFSSPRQYASRLVVHSSILTNQEAIEIVDAWEELLSKHEYATLANTFNCKEEVLKKLSKISAEEILKLYVQNNPNGFIIKVTVKDVSILDQLRTAIVYGLDNSPYANEKIEAEKAKFNKLIVEVKNEISKVDETKSEIDAMIKNKTVASTPMLVYLSRINAEWMELNEKLLSYQEQLQFANGLQVLSSFNKGKLERPNPLKFIVFGLAAGAFLGYLLSLILYVWRKIESSKELYQ